MGKQTASLLRLILEEGQQTLFFFFFFFPFFFFSFFLFRKAESPLVFLLSGTILNSGIVIKVQDVIDFFKLSLIQLGCFLPVV